ncbi:MAG: hypothetical protein SGI83_05525 [Bacteroidota bacterium]|nr:hypothetical protein [Bacteroidota bacterium]
MANKQTDRINNSNKELQQNKVKAFEQGNGNNSTTADPKKKDTDPDFGKENGNESGRQLQKNYTGDENSDITNHHQNVTSKDKTSAKSAGEQGDLVDDEDVDEENTSEEIDGDGRDNDEDNKPGRKDDNF